MHQNSFILQGYKWYRMVKISFELDEPTAQKLRELVVRRMGGLRKQSLFVANLVSAEIERDEMAKEV